MSEQGFKPVGREMRLDPTMGELVSFRSPLLREACAEVARSVYASDVSAYGKVEAMPMPDITAQPTPQPEAPRVASTAVNATVEQPANDLLKISEPTVSSEAYFDALMNRGSEGGQSQTAPEA